MLQERKKQDNEKYNFERLQEECNELKRENLMLRSKLNKMEKENQKYNNANHRFFSEFHSLKERNQHEFDLLKLKLESDIIEIRTILDKYSILEHHHSDNPFIISHDLLLQSPEEIEEFTCLFCCNLVQKPIECKECQRIYCEDCIEQYCTQRKNECPNCRIQPFSGEKINRIIGNLLHKFKFKCPLECGEIIEYSNIENHKKMKINHKCNLCDTVLQHEENMKENHKSHCEILKFTCSYCKSNMMKQNYESHIKLCPQVFAYCGVCNINIPKSYQKEHENFFCKENVSFIDCFSRFITNLKE